MMKSGVQIIIRSHYQRLLCLLCVASLTLVVDNYFCVSFSIISSRSTRRAVIVTKHHANDKFIRIHDNHSSLLLQNQPEDHHEEQTKPLATIEGYLSQDEKVFLQQILCRVGFDFISSSDDSRNKNNIVYRYKYVKASGMLKLVENDAYNDNRAPKWIPTQSGEEVSVSYARFLFCTRKTKSHRFVIPVILTKFQEHTCGKWMVFLGSR